MIPAVEVLVSTARVRELIQDPQRTRELHDAIASGREPYGMISFDQSLTELVQRKLITYDDAARNATNADDFALHFKGFSKGSWATASVTPAAPPAHAYATQIATPPTQLGGASTTQVHQATATRVNNQPEDFHIDRFGK